MKFLKYILIVAISVSTFTASAINCYVNVKKACPAFVYDTEWPEGPVEVSCKRDTAVGKKWQYSEAKRDMTNGKYCTLYLLTQRCDYICTATLISDGSFVSNFYTYRNQKNNCATNECVECSN